MMAMMNRLQQRNCAEVYPVTAMQSSPNINKLKYKQAARMIEGTFANKSEDDDDKEEDHRVVCLTVKA